jgi:DNA-binding GntR family transcriptional regulator
VTAVSARPTHTQAKAESTTTYQQQAYEFLKGQIMSLELKPGQLVTDSQVAEKLSISRTPVREALRRLQQERLLVKEARRGWKVVSLSIEDIRDMFEIKLLLEGLIARKAAACQDEALRDALRETMERMERAALDNAYELWREMDIRLHQIIFEMCPNERAGRIIRSLNDQWYRVRVGFIALEGRVERSNREHWALVESILSGDGDRAEKEMRAHLGNVRDELVRVLQMVMPFMHNGI